MKNHTFATILLTFFLQNLNADILVNQVSISTIGGDDPFFGDHSLGLLTTGGGVGFNVYVGDTNSQYVTASSATLGVYHSWYKADSGVVFNYAYRLGNVAFYNDTPSLGNKFLVNQGEKFYLGFFVDAGGGGPGENLHDYYGWVQLQRTELGLSLLGSALDNTGNGIVIGSTAAVPEPSTYALMGLGLLVVIGYKNRAKWRFGKRS